MKLKRFVLGFFFLLSSDWTSEGEPAAAPISAVSISDEAPNHIHPEGSPFTITLAVDANTKGTICYQWQDFDGKPLGPNVALVSGGGSISIESPSGDRGYYGLALIPSPNVTLPNRQPGETREYGFVVVPPPTIYSSVNSPFGTVHTDPKDRYMPPWSKTTFWGGTPGQWRSRMTSLRQQGKTELPVITGQEWATDDSIPVSPNQLRKLQTKAMTYFLAHPETGYWEAGLEENLSSNYVKTYYWPNLQAKAQSLRAAAVAAHMSLKLIYQVAARSPSLAVPFLQSAASQEFDILSMHPYAWPNFPSPDTWMANFLAGLKVEMAANGRIMPIWFTEIGAPEFGNYKGGFFGYPKDQKATGGLSRPEMASFIVKASVIALANGVQRLFWYNYRDWGDARDAVEVHFGLLDYWGYPKPAYAAYEQLTQLLAGLEPVGLRKVGNDLSLSEFSNKKRRVFVAWTLIGEATLQPSMLSDKLASWDGITITDIVGHPLTAQNGKISVSGMPVFFETKNP